MNDPLCLMCGRAMVDWGDGDDRDCGGDCWGCIREDEANAAGDHPPAEYPTVTSHEVAPFGGVARPWSVTVV